MDFITPSQCRAARGLLNWSQPELAEKCGIHTQTISAFENETSTPTKTTLEKIKVSFEDNGVGFGSDETVKKLSTNIKTLVGKKGFLEFFQDLYKEIEKSKPREIFVSNVDEHDFVKAFGTLPPKEHIHTILKYGVHYKILVKEGDTFFPAAQYADYRWTLQDQFYSVPFYIYGNKVAMIIFEENNVKIYIINEPAITELHKKQFLKLWEDSIEPDVKGYKP